MSESEHGAGEHDVGEDDDGGVAAGDEVDACLIELREGHGLPNPKRLAVASAFIRHAIPL